MKNISVPSTGPSRPFFHLAALACCLGLGVAPTAPGATYLWNVASPAASAWNANANWSPATGNPGALDTAVFGTVGTASGSTSVNNLVSVNTIVTALTFTNNTSGNWHVTDIPANVTLTVTNLTVGGLSVASGAPVTQVAMFDAGTLVVNGSLTVGNNDSGTTAGSSGTLDLSGLSNFVYSAAAGTITLSTGARSSGNLYLATVSNSVTAATINDNTAQGSSTATGNVNLGQGTNVINVGAFNIGAGRGSTTVGFPSGSTTGGLRVRGVAGTDASQANMTIGNRNNGGGSGNSINCTLAANGHPLDARLGTLILGESGSNPTGTANGNGTLSFDTGTVYASNIIMAVSSGSTAGVAANGTLNVGSANSTNATLIIGPGGMSMANRSGSAGTAAGNLNVTGGTVICSNNIFKTTSGSSTATITLNSGFLILPGTTNTVGTAAAPIDTVTLSTAALGFSVDGNAQNGAYIYASSVSASGPTTINVNSVTNVVFAVTIHLISFGAGGDPGLSNFQLGTTPAGYNVALADNVNNDGCIDLVIGQNVPFYTVLWRGAVGSSVNTSWDFTTANWLNLANGSSLNYTNPDIVNFDDSASNAVVTLAANLNPGGFTFSNSVLNYVLGGAGSIGGNVGLVMDGSASVTLAETGGDNFSGGVAVNSGTVILDDAGSAISGTVNVSSGATLQIGNGDAKGNLPTPPGGTVTVNGTLIFDQSTNSTLAAALLGAGALTQNGSGVLTLSVSNAYTGNTTVNGGTLALTNAGSIVNSAQVSVNNATLDVSGVSGVTTLTALSLANAGLTVSVGYLQTNLNVASLSLGGSANTINVRALPPMAYYPTTVTLLQSGGTISGYNFVRGSLPVGYSGTLAESADQTAVLLTLTSGPTNPRPYISWSGMDALGNVSSNWSDALNWQTPGAPVASDFVIFNDTAAQAASALATPGGGLAALNVANVGNIVDANTSIATLVFTNISSDYHNTYLKPGVTLTVTNSLSFGSSSVDFGTAAKEFVTVAGATGTLSVSNPASTLFVGLESVGGGAQATLDMSALGAFNATVSVFAVGAMATTAVMPSGVAWLAQTNFIKATGGSPNEAGQDESLSLMVGQSGKGGTTESFLYLGQVNVFYANSIGVGISKQTAEMQFNPLWPNPTVTLLGTNGVGPVSVWDIGDGLAQTGSSTAPNGIVDFTGGTVNAAVTTLMIGRSPNASGTHAATGSLTFGAGTIAAGTITAGYQPYSDTDFGVGTLNVNGTGLLQVNTLNLALTTGNTGAASTLGTLSITNGTVQAGTINADTNNAGQSTINLTSGTLILTNTIGSPASPLTTLALTGGALQLNPDGTGNLTNIIATTITTSGTTTINIGAVKNAAPNSTLQLPLLSYTGSDPFAGFTLGTVPAGYTSASLVDDTAKQTIDLLITTPAVVAPTIPPGITGLSLASGNVVINGTNGQPGRTYYLLSSTNLTLPRNQWAAVATNVLGSAAFTFIGTNAVTPNRPQQFYILSGTNN